MGIIKDMFPGYCSGIDIEALGSSNSSFALEPLKENVKGNLYSKGDVLKNTW